MSDTGMNFGDMSSSSDYEMKGEIERARERERLVFERVKLEKGERHYDGDMGVGVDKEYDTEDCKDEDDEGKYEESEYDTEHKEAKDEDEEHYNKDNELGYLEDGQDGGNVDHSIYPLGPLINQVAEAVEEDEERYNEYTKSSRRLEANQNRQNFHHPAHALPSVNEVLRQNIQQSSYHLGPLNEHREDILSAYPLEPLIEDSQNTHQSALQLAPLIEQTRQNVHQRRQHTQRKQLREFKGSLPALERVNRRLAPLIQQAPIIIGHNRFTNEPIYLDAASTQQELAAHQQAPLNRNNQIVRQPRSQPVPIIQQQQSAPAQAPLVSNNQTIHQPSYPPAVPPYIQHQFSNNEITTVAAIPQQIHQQPPPLQILPQVSLPRFPSLPVTTRMNNLSTLHALRVPVLRPKKTFNPIRPSNREALLGQHVGRLAMEVKGRQCVTCMRSLGPWTLCVVVQGEMIGSCANCWYSGEGSRCSFRNPEIYRQNKVIGPCSRRPPAALQAAAAAGSDVITLRPYTDGHPNANQPIASAGPLNLPAAAAPVAPVMAGNGNNNHSSFSSGHVEEEEEEKEYDDE